MTKKAVNSILTIVIASVWVVNGLYCKILGAVPRHEHIVAEILGSPHAKLIIVAIGFSEVALAVWFPSCFYV
ncbi:DoxX-like family protein [Sphingobacterium paludis]|uniref:DoxX-like protein n=1 Tax=Sphingobacterium paludis TaxID=1476465 RepID=A0A4R7D152_9SPHI|nr:DoxX-like family protein [Sphingobacterium paludis]TDS14683.1 DoxX-like protein [Sphingobacterium paludis]